MSAEKKLNFTFPSLEKRGKSKAQKNNRNLKCNAADAIKLLISLSQSERAVYTQHFKSCIKQQ